MAMSEEAPEDNGEGMLAPEFEAMCANYIEKKELEGEAKRAANYYAQNIKEAMGTNRFLEAGKYTVTWQTQQRKGYEVPAGTTRRFSIKERTDGGD